MNNCILSHAVPNHEDENDKKDIYRVVKDLK